MCLIVYKNATFREVVYRRGKRVFDIHGPFTHCSEAITKGRRNQYIN